MDTNKIFHQNLKAAREHRSLSLLQLQELTGYNRQAISTLEYAIHDVSLANAVKLARALDYDLPSLFKRTFDRSKAPAFQEQDYLGIFSENVQRLLLKKHWHQYSIAVKAGLDKTTVSKILSKKVNPKLSTLIRIAEVFGTELQELLTRK